MHKRPLSIPIGLTPDLTPTTINGFTHSPLTTDQSSLFESLNVNKDDLTQAIYETHGGISYAEAQRIMDLILDIIKKRLVRGEKVLLSRFGAFRVVRRRDRKGINPQTGAPMVIPGRRAISFKPSKYLKSV